jgi:hypothetical protein
MIGDIEEGNPNLFDEFNKEDHTNDEPTITSNEL